MTPLATERPPYFVGEGGLEPPRSYEHWHLKPARLPFRHSPEQQGGQGTETPAPTPTCPVSRPSPIPFTSMVGGVFSRAFRGNVRPIEIGRRLITEIDANRSVDSKGRRVVPNHFLVHLSPADLEALESVRRDLLAELVEAVKEYAVDEGYHLKGSVSVAIDADDSLKVGRVKVSSEIRATGTTAVTAVVVLPDGRRLTLGSDALVVGRSADNAIVFEDPNVSRRHAEISAAAGGWVVKDLGSTNGTKVNGVLISGERSLRDGDIVSFGSHTIRYEARQA